MFRLLDKQEERVLCLAWHHLGVRLAGGTTDAIRVWDPKKGLFIVVVVVWTYDSNVCI